ncbi:MAG: nitroreductase [Sneathiellaceae bacterium]
MDDSPAPRPPSPQGEAVLRALLERRSTSPRRLQAPGPTQAELRLMAAAAGRAPDHGGLRPWRFLQVEGAARTALGALCAHALAEEDPDATAEMCDRERQKIATGPCLVAVLADLRPDLPEIPVSEQQASVGAAIHGFLLAAAALGYGGIMLSGRRVRRPALRAALGLGPDRHLVGFLTLGRPEDRPGRAARGVQPATGTAADGIGLAETADDLTRLLSGS